VLREKWPLAFPVKHQDIRPLAMGVARQVAAAMGWSPPYTLGVLGRWKMGGVPKTSNGTPERTPLCRRRTSRISEQ
jgi:hypothetical protein